MGKLQLFQILLDNPQAVFQPGQVISGQVIIQLNEEMKMRGLRIKFHGGARVHWSERHSTGSGKNRRTVTRHYHNNQQYFDLVAVLFGKADGQSGTDPMHPVGRHVYPFQFTLPVNLPSSFEGQWGQVRYWLQGVIDKPWKFDHKCKMAFTVLAPLDLNVQPNAAVPQQGQDQKTLCCLCCKSGPISAVFTMDRKCFVPGEYITVSGEVTNHSNRKMSSSSVELRMTTVFRATTKSRSHRKIVSKIRKGEIEPGDSETWNQERLFIPPLPPSMLPFCDIINIFYHVVMIVDPSGPGFDLEVPLEIIIGTIPLRNVQYLFANAPCTYTLPPSYEDAADGDPPPAPALASNVPQPSAPPPSYAECVLGKVDIHDEGDTEHTQGEMNWAPKYTYYTWGNPGNQPT